MNQPLRFRLTPKRKNVLTNSNLRPTSTLKTNKPKPNLTLNSHQTPKTNRSTPRNDSREVERIGSKKITVDDFYLVLQDKYLCISFKSTNP